MEHLYLCKNSDELTKLQKHANALKIGLESYLDDLRKYMRVEELPKCIIWTEEEFATKLLADIPIPAYTDDRRTVVVPYPDVWKKIYLCQIKEYNQDRPEVQEVRAYYENCPVNQIRQIVGHEFVHWSEFFDEELYDETIWFEEGMAEYVSRKWFLTEEEYAKEKRINQILIDLYEEMYEAQPLENFNYNSYGKEMNLIFYFYWKSFLFIERLVEQKGGNMGEVIKCYQRWCETNREISLLEWFLIK
ncbi:MAG: elongation factor Tu [Lachnospiraceae bacterium]|nr:elongation factor Tu [Lachnospiraceae bacterium]